MLDEPTNDLDLGTLRLLEEALVAFGGCVIVVSHDRYFLNRVCTSILAFEGEGHVVYSVGNYDYYLEKRGAPGPVHDSYPTPAGAAAEQRKSQDKPRKLKWKEEREWESMEANILSAENEVSDLEATFAAPDFYAKPRSEIFETLSAVHPPKAVRRNTSRSFKTFVCSLVRRSRRRRLRKM
jgi:ATP-binding cassette subfamily F protein uup